MLTFHGKQELKDEVLAQLKAHREADAIVQGTYWRDGKGCAVGCLTHDPDGGHDQYPERWGLPEWLARLEDTIFEGLSIDEAKEWPIRLMSAIPVGVEITDAVADRLAIERLEQECLPLAPTWPESIRGQVVDAINGVIEVIRDGGNRSAAESAARSAESAAWSAWSARSAADSAARSAWSAAMSAAESAARSAAMSAAYTREAGRLIEALESLAK